MTADVKHGERHAAVRRGGLARPAVHRDRVPVGVEVHTGGVGRDEQAAPRPARQGEVRGPHDAVHEENAPRVVGPFIQGVYSAVRGDPVEGDLMIARREPAERDEAVRPDGLAARAVHPDGIAVRIDCAPTVRVGSAAGLDVDNERAAVRQRQLRLSLRTLWIVTRGREPEHRERRGQAAQFNGAYHGSSKPSPC